MAGAASERRRKALRRRIARLEAEIARDRRELGSMEGGFARGKARVDRALDAEVTRRYRLVEGDPRAVSELAKEFGIPGYQPRRIAKRHDDYQRKHPKEPAPSIQGRTVAVRSSLKIADALEAWLGELDRQGEAIVSHLQQMQAAVEGDPHGFDPGRWAGVLGPMIKDLRRHAAARPSAEGQTT